jgi:HlyD family secretion protein
MTKSEKRLWPKRLLISFLAVCALTTAGWYYKQLPDSLTNYESATISRGALLQLVTASGQLNPVLKVEVGSQISGNIDQLLVDFNSPVKQGQVIAKLDPATYDANLIQAQGNLANAKAGLELAQINAERAKALRANKLNPEADYDKALADLHQAEANVKINEGALKKAEADQARCTIYAPIDGIVISRNVNVGQTVAASLSAPVLFVIANDLTKMQIEANVAEADIGLVEVGQEIQFTVDAFPGRTFPGKVTQIRNAPRTDQNVVTYDTMIDVSNPEMKLKPGMTANVSIIVARREKALRIPNGALRFHPPEGAVVKKTQASASDATTAAKSNKKSANSSHKKDKKKTERMVYLLSDSSSSTNSVRRMAMLQAQQIKTGISDGSYTEVMEGLQEGDEVVVNLSTKAGSTQTLNPFSNRKRH